MREPRSALAVARGMPLERERECVCVKFVGVLAEGFVRISSGSYSVESPETKEN